MRFTFRLIHHSLRLPSFTRTYNRSLALPEQPPPNQYLTRVSKTIKTVHPAAGMEVPFTPPMPSDILLEDLLNASTLPSLDSLPPDSRTCPICADDFSTEPTFEAPIRLPCGHIYGIACIMMWLCPPPQPSSNVTINNNCPHCRRTILENPSYRPRRGRPPRVWDRAAHDEHWFQQLQAWSASNNNLNVPDSPEARAWARRADELWVQVLDAVLASLRDTEAMEDGEAWLCGPLAVLLHLLGCVTVGRWYEYYTANDLQGRREELMADVPIAFAALRAHVDGERVRGRTHVFFEPDREASLRIAAYHGEIEESRMRLIGRLRRAGRL